jgi:NAD(P)H dehydrogenase (quinone)
VASRLARQGVAQRLIVRDVARAPALEGAEVAAATYLDRPSMIAALRGIDTVFFVSGFEAEDRLRHHEAAVDAFVDAGVTRVVYTSFLGAAADATFTLARQHFHTEEYLAAAGLRFVALRNSLYIDVLPHLAADGVIRGPAGNGRFAPVSRDDIADVAVALLLDDAAETSRLAVTGPELVTMSEVAKMLAEHSGGPVIFVNETVDEAFASRAHYGAPAFEVEGWVTSYLAIAAGEMDVVSDTVARIAGHPPISPRAFLAAQ